MPKLTSRTYNLTDAESIAKLLADVDRSMVELDARTNRELSSRIVRMRTRIEPVKEEERGADHLKPVVL